MTSQGTIGRSIAAGFAVVVALGVITGAIAIFALNSVVNSKDDVIDIDARVLIDVQHLKAASSDKSAAVRGYLLTKDEALAAQVKAGHEDFLTTLDEVLAIIPDTSRAGLLAIGKLEATHQVDAEAVMASRRAGTPLEDVIAEFKRTADLSKSALTAGLDGLIRTEETRLASARDGSSATADRNVAIVVVVVLVGVLAASVLAFLITRRLRRSISATVGEIRSSASELQAAANQQATGATEQATAMNEITTTITELLATSRQIAESAQQVSTIADRTAGAGRAGESIVATALVSINDIRQQVDVIVSHMLDLGEKSQRIGAVLDIVSELAEQTNILAINSTIEAAGAGEAGKRFGVVADEIRKLADRVADSTKEIRGLIDVVRGAVNTTVMATEIGSKAVDAGSKQFSDVATSFGEIAGMVVTTTEAAREIELSTKQQSTAVEQVNFAVTGAAQATRESEASSSQTLQTASQLSNLAKDLQRMIERDTVGV